MQISGLTFKLTCSTGSGDQRAERRYATYTGGTHQFEGSFKIISMGGSYYDKFGSYRTASGKGPITVEWSGVRFWHR